MSIFSRSEGPKKMSKQDICSFLGAGTKYQGTLQFEGSVRIDGSYDGEIISEGTLIIGKDAVVNATIKVGELVLNGKLTGDISISRRLVVHQTGIITGTIATPKFIVEEGAIIDGTLKMMAGEAE